MLSIKIMASYTSDGCALEFVPNHKTTMPKSLFSSLYEELKQNSTYRAIADAVVEGKENISNRIEQNGEMVKEKAEKLKARAEKAKEELQKNSTYQSVADAVKRESLYEESKQNSTYRVIADAVVEKAKEEFQKNLTYQSVADAVKRELQACEKLVQQKRERRSIVEIGTTYRVIADAVVEKAKEELQKNPTYQSVADAVKRELQAGEKLVQQKRKRRSIVEIGTLTVKVIRICLTNLGNDYYVKIKIEDKEKQCNVRNSPIKKPSQNNSIKKLSSVTTNIKQKENCCKPSDTSAKQFRITDITGDIILQVYSKITFLNDKLLGQVLIPLSHLLPSNIPSIIRTPPANGTIVLPPNKPFNHWYEIYPLPEIRHKFVPGVEEMPGTAMERPAETIGFVHAEVQLFLEQSVLNCYGVSSPYISPSVESVEPHIIKNNILRIQRALGFMPSKQMDNKLNVGKLKVVQAQLQNAEHPMPKQTDQPRVVNSSEIIGEARDTDKTKDTSSNLRQLKWGLLTFFVHILSWESPPLSIFTLAFVYYVCMRAPLYTLPLHFAIVFIIYSHSSRNHESYDYILTWNDEIVEDRNDPVTWFGKLTKAKNIMLYLQLTLGTIASILEKLNNIVNWTDPTVTLIAHIAIVVLSLVFTILLYCFSWVIVYINLTCINLTFGSAVFLSFASVMILPYIWNQIRHIIFKWCDQQKKVRQGIEENIEKNEKEEEKKNSKKSNAENEKQTNKIDPDKTNIENEKKEYKKSENEATNNENKINEEIEKKINAENEKREDPENKAKNIKNEKKINEIEKKIKTNMGSKSKPKKRSEYKQSEIRKRIKILLSIVSRIFFWLYIFVMNVIDRIPDDQEVSHRIISKRQVFCEEGPNVQNMEI